MEINKSASAGTLESSDVLVSVKKNSGLKLDIQSDVMEQYGDSIKEIIAETLEELNVKNAHVKINDKGALDYTIKARLKTALERASK